MIALCVILVGMGWVVSTPRVLIETSPGVFAYFPVPARDFVIMIPRCSPVEDYSDGSVPGCPE